MRWFYDHVGRRWKSEAERQRASKRQHDRQKLLDEICALLPTNQESARASLQHSTDEQLAELLKRLRVLPK